MDLIPGRLYRRRDLHDAFGGQWQGGISTPADHPVILLFTGESGLAFGYEDGYEDDGTYRYIGEGQVGDMTMDKGNRAIRDHVDDGKTLHLFKTRSDRYQEYQGEVSCVDHREIVAPDKNENPRRAFAEL
jgi:5-methylcytosine-specific restriction protein A